MHVQQKKCKYDVCYYSMEGKYILLKNAIYFPTNNKIYARIYIAAFSQRLQNGKYEDTFCFTEVFFDRVIFVDLFFYAA